MVRIYLQRGVYLDAEQFFNDMMPGNFVGNGGDIVHTIHNGNILIIVLNPRRVFQNRYEDNLCQEQPGPLFRPLM
jgi:hypothetical protein